MSRWMMRAGAAGGALCALLALLLFAFGLPLVGASRQSFAAFATGVVALFTLTCFGVAIFVVARSRKPMAVLAAAMMAVLGGAGAPYTDALAARTGFFVPARLGSFLLIALVTAFLFLFPTGRWVPRWAVVPFGIWASVTLTVMLATPVYPAGNPPDVWAQLMLLGFLGGLAAQGWRWFKVSDTVARAQTKWVLFGAATAIAATIASAFVPALAPSTDRAALGFAVVTLGSLAIPVTIGIAVTRYRLWDVDLIINRTAVYAAVVGILVAVYLAIVLGAETALSGRGQTLLSLAAAGLVAVLFQPLRQAIQRLVNRIMYGDRDDPRAVLHRLGEALDESVAGGGVLPRIASTLASALRLPYAAVVLRDGDVFSAGRRGEPDADLLRLPLAHQGDHVGDLQLAPRGPRDPFTTADMELLRELSVHVAAAAQGVLLAAELRHSRERLVNARAEERRRLRRDLHDGLGPQLVSLALKLEACRNRNAEDAEINQTLTELADQTRGVIGDLRRVVYALRPPALDELGLVAALEQAGQLASDGVVDFDFEHPGDLPPLPAAVEVAAYRITQEALTNVVRHSGARHCRLKLSMARDGLRLEISDDGLGLPGGIRSGIGLGSMRERAEELGGRLDVHSSAGKGTRLEALLPCTVET